MAKPPRDNPLDDQDRPAPGMPGNPGESIGDYELADDPDALDDGPPPAVASAQPIAQQPAAAPGDTPPTDQPSAAPPPPSQCPHCKKTITGNMLAGNCPHCGKRIIDPTADGTQSTKHANAALVLGILSIPLGLTCLGLLGTIFGSVLGAILGGVAVHFARQAKQEIAQGHAPPASEGAANLGHLCGIIGVVLGCALTVFYAAMQLIAFALDF